MTVFTLLHRLSARLRNDDKGAVMAEYGLLAVGIAMAVAGAVFALGHAIDALYDIPAPF
jgi:Flp pilus assembly pilin Flp